jgi:hypothetical protein
MQSHQFIKYAFRIRTKLGVVVDNLMIHGRDEHEAQRKCITTARSSNAFATTAASGFRWQVSRKLRTSSFVEFAQGDTSALLPLQPGFLEKPRRP